MCPSNEIVAMGRLSEVFGSTFDTLITPGGIGCGRYSILQVLGTGNSGAVYEVKSNDPSSSENSSSTFACKVINLKQQRCGDDSSSPAALQCGATSISDCLREASIMAGLNHPNLPCLRNFFVDEEGRDFCIISDVARGGTVLDALRYRGSFAEEDARAVMSGVLRALDHLHARGIAHRDVKIENVLLVDEDSLSKVQLHDMGMAKRVGRLPRKCHTRCGTPLCIAPEMLSPSSSKIYSASSDTGNRPAYGTQVDLWSCGVMLYNLLSGYMPFMAGTTRGLWGRIVRCNYNFDDPVWHLISEDAKNLIQKLLVLDPDMRLTAAEALQHPWMRET